MDIIIRFRQLNTTVVVGLILAASILLVSSNNTPAVGVSTPSRTPAPTYSATTVSSNGYRVQLVTNDPSLKNTPAGARITVDDNVEASFDALVASALPGSFVYGSFFRLGGQNSDTIEGATNRNHQIQPNIAAIPPYLALEQANSSGVHVQIVDDRADKESTTSHSLALQKLFGTNVASPSSFHFCSRSSASTACSTSNPHSVQHAKYALLSKVKLGNTSYSDVVWISSENFVFSSGRQDRNNALIVYGDSLLYGKVLNEFRAQQKNRVGTIPSTYTSSKSKVSVISPPIVDANTDPVAGYLTNSFAKYSGQAGCQAYVASPSFSGRPKLSKVLNQLARYGCTVYIITLPGRLDSTSKAQLSKGVTSHMKLCTNQHLHDKEAYA